MTIEWLLNLETQITKAKQRLKNIVLIVTKTIKVFQIVIKNNVMKNIKDIKIRDQELLNYPLYNISAVNLVIHKKIEMKTKMIILLEITIVLDLIRTITPTTTTDIEIITDIEATVEIIHKIITNLTLDKDITIDLQVFTHLDPDMTIIIKQELHLDLHTDLPIETTLIIDTILDQDIDLVLNHKETPLDDTIIHTDLHPDQGTIDQDLEHLHKTDNKIE